MKLQPNQKQIVEVKACDTFSGAPVIEVSVGEVYCFKADQGKNWKDWFIRSSASGFWNPLVPKSMRRVKEAKVFELCGTIGENEDNHFRIGMGLQNFTVTNDGSLYFFPNDSLKWYWNNKGIMTVEVWRES